MTYRRTSTITGTLLIAAVLPVWSLFAKESEPPRKRARPPKWSADVQDVFFEDARAKLVGERPHYGAVVAAAEPNLPGPSVDVINTDAGSAWSKLIDAESIETEIKRLANALQKSATTPSKFKGGGYEDCRRYFSELAMLFAIVAEYDGDVRWKDSGAALRDLFARAGHNCKVGTDQTFNEAVQRKQDLADLISGSRPSLPKADAEAEWGQVVDRPPLMQRLEAGHQKRLTKWLANQREFEKNADNVRHEAQIVAAIADVIGREGFDYWDEEEYARHARGLREAATEIAAAVELNNFDQAKKAVNQATKSCADCHELYRG